MSRKVNKPRAYTWVAYMMTHAPEEVARVRKYGTPSDRFIRMASKPIFMTVKSGEIRKITFPVSLNTNRGQKLLFSIIERVDMHLKALPIKTFELFQHVKKTVTHRRSDTQANLHMVAEAIIHRAACEFKPEVLFAFDSINAWIRAKYHKTLGYVTLHKALELLEEAGIIKVVEWGKRGTRHKATKIEIILLPTKTTLNFTSEVDEWLLLSDHAMQAVYNRESVTRQDVLEAAIHSYSSTIDPASFDNMDRLLRLFNRPADDTMAEVDVAVMEEVTDDYFNRLLGQLVSTVQQDDSVGRKVGTRILRPVNTS